MVNSFAAFQQKLVDIAQLKSAFAVLNWDKDVFMPPKGSGPRAAMLGYLAGELHDKVLSKEFREMLRDAKAAGSEDPRDGRVRKNQIEHHRRARAGRES